MPPVKTFEFISPESNPGKESSEVTVKSVGIKKSQTLAWIYDIQIQYELKCFINYHSSSLFTARIFHVTNFKFQVGMIIIDFLEILY